MSQGNEHPAVKTLEQTFPGVVKNVGVAFGETAIMVDKSDLAKVCWVLRDNAELSYDHLSDLCGVDYLGKKDARFEVVYQLYSTKTHERLRIKVPVNEGERVPTVCNVWAGANWLERECWEMFGVFFDNHPDLRRLLTIDEYEGYPLRKDFPLMGKTEIAEGIEGGVKWRKRG
jgi:NADH-quinone oxidoreductase subunit C